MQTTHHMLRVPGNMAGFEQGAHQLRALLDHHQITGRLRIHVELVFEEVVTNVVRHGYQNDGTRHVDVAVTIGDSSIEMIIEDDGRPFDPLQRPNPVLPKTIETATLGGLGILLTRKASERLHYERTADEKNRLVATIAR